MELNRNTEVESLQVSPPDAKPMLPAVPSSVVYNEDCVEALKRFPENYFDLAIVDPPYGIGADKAQNNAAMQRIKADGKSKAGRGWKLYADTDWDNETPNAEYWQELFRVSKNQIVWGGNYFTDYLPPSMGWITRDIVTGKQIGRAHV